MSLTGGVDGDAAGHVRREQWQPVIEIRTYRTVPGAGAKVLEALRACSFPKDRAIGMKVLGRFPSAEDDQTFVWLRVFPDAASRDGMKAAFYEGKLWSKSLNCR